MSISNIPFGSKSHIDTQAEGFAGAELLPLLPNGPLAGQTKVVSVTTTAQDVAIPEGTGIAIIKVLQASTCGYVGYRFKYPGATSDVVLGNNGTFQFSLEPGREIPEAPVDGATALSIACDADTADVHVIFRT